MGTIYLANLKQAGACRTQIRIFEHTFGEYTAVNVKLAAKHWYKFDFVWAADVFLSASAYMKLTRRLSYNPLPCPYRDRTLAEAFSVAFNSKENALVREALRQQAKAAGVKI